MKTALIVIVTALVTVAAPAAAQYGSIGPYADRGGCVCDIVDTYGLMHVYVVHRDMTAGVKGSRFTISGDALPYLTFLYANPIGDLFIQGDIVDGYTVSYGDCQTTGLAIMEIGYFGSGLTPNCSDLRVVAAPTASTGEVEAFDCNDEVFPATGGVAYVSVILGECYCTSPYCVPVPVEDSTWGGIKALYR